MRYLSIGLDDKNSLKLLLPPKAFRIFLVYLLALDVFIGVFPSSSSSGLMTPSMFLAL